MPSPLTNIPREQHQTLPWYLMWSSSAKELYPCHTDKNVSRTSSHETGHKYKFTDIPLKRVLNSKHALQLVVGEFVPMAVSWKRCPDRQKTKPKLHYHHELRLCQLSVDLRSVWWWDWVFFRYWTWAWWSLRLDKGWLARLLQFDLWPLFKCFMLSHIPCLDRKCFPSSLIWKRFGHQINSELPFQRCMPCTSLPVFF